MSTISQFTPDQYSQILKMLDTGKEVIPNHLTRTAGMSFTAEAIAKWIVDSGASSHMVGRLDLLSEHYQSKGQVLAPTGSLATVKHIGSTSIFPGQRITNVMHIPEFKYKFLSV